MEHQCEVVIIGSGFAGLCMAIELQKAGITDFVILEKAAAVGGTWRENTYPGAECDIPTALYSYSFEQNADWDYRWAEQAQILEYIRAVADKHALYDKLHFSKQLTSARYQESSGEWALETADGTHYRCRYFVTAVGQLHHPKRPQIPGLENFKGSQFHSAEWDHSVDLSGKRVAVIGTGASAIQFIPPVADQAAELHVFQRSANWILEKMDHPYSDWQKRLRQWFPFIKQLDRFRTWCRGEIGVWPVMKGNPLFRFILTRWCMRYLQKQISDPDKRQKLTPDYVIGAKRILFSDDYYEALNKPHVQLHTEPVEQLIDSTIAWKSGTADIDVVIYGTGFITNPFLSDLSITGKSGRDIHDHWQSGAEAYLGISLSDFPNFFMLYGPNTNLGHNSIILMIEAQSRYILQCINMAKNGNAKAIELKAEVQRVFNEELQARLSNTVWNQADSWYTDGGRITNNWAGTTIEYRRRTRKADPNDFQLSGAL